MLGAVAHGNPLPQSIFRAKQSATAVKQMKIEGFRRSFQFRSAVSTIASAFRSFVIARDTDCGPHTRMPRSQTPAMVDNAANPAKSG